MPQVTNICNNPLISIPTGTNQINNLICSVRTPRYPFKINNIIKTKSDVIIVVIIDRNTSAFASSSSSGSIIASSYFQLETTEIIPTIDKYNAKIPKFSGVNNLVNIGVAAINKPCDM